VVAILHRLGQHQRVALLVVGVVGNLEIVGLFVVVGSSVVADSFVADSSVVDSSVVGSYFVG